MNNYVSLINDQIIGSKNKCGLKWLNVPEKNYDQKINVPNNSAHTLVLKQ